jgi:hypothetical protein
MIAPISIGPELVRIDYDLGPLCQGLDICAAGGISIVVSAFARCSWGALASALLGHSVSSFFGGLTSATSPASESSASSPKPVRMPSISIIRIGGPVFFVLGGVCFVVWRGLARGCRLPWHPLRMRQYPRLRLWEPRTSGCRTWHISHCGPSGPSASGLIS